MRTGWITVLLVAVIIIAITPLWTQGQTRQPSNPEEDAARQRVQRAQARLRAVQRSLSGAEERQRGLMREVEKLRADIVEGEAIVQRNGEQVVTAQAEGRAAEAKVQQAVVDRDRSRERMEQKRAEVDEAKVAAVRDYEGTAEFVALVAARDAAQVKADAAAKACLERLGETTEYKNAVTAREAARTRLDEVRSTGDTAQITAASRSALEATNRVSVLEDAAYEADPAVVETRAALKEAEDRLRAARAEFEKRWLAGPEAAQVQQAAETVQREYLAAVKAQDQAEAERADLDRRAQKMAAELKSRQRKLAQADEQAKAMDREVDTLDRRIRDLQLELSQAEAEYQVAVTQLQRVIRAPAPRRP